MTIKHGLATKLGVLIAILSLLPPLAMQVIALVENTSVHFTEGNKIALISGAVVALITMLGKFGQAIAAILKGQTNV